MRATLALWCEPGCGKMNLVCCSPFQRTDFNTHVRTCKYLRRQCESTKAVFNKCTAGVPDRELALLCDCRIWEWIVSSYHIAVRLFSSYPSPVQPKEQGPPPPPPPSLLWHSECLRWGLLRGMLHFDWIAVLAHTPCKYCPKRFLLYWNPSIQLLLLQLPEAPQI